MRMTDTERRSLARSLFGTAQEPGPLDAAWVKRNLTGTGTTLKRWRDHGIPPDKIEDVLEKVREALPYTTKEADPPEWAGRLQERIDSIYERQVQVGQDMAGKVIEALAPLDRLKAVEQLAEWLATLPPPSAADPHDSPDTAAPDTARPEGQASS